MSRDFYCYEGVWRATDEGPPSGPSGPPVPADTVAIWWADDLGLADAAEISSWTDRVSSVAVTQGAAGKYPVMDIDGIGGMPAALFDGTNDFLRSDSVLTSSNNGCVVMVAKPTATGNRVAWSAAKASSNKTYNMGFAGGASGYMDHYNRNEFTLDWIAGNTDPTNRVGVYEWASDGSAVSMRVDNSVESLSVINGANNGDWFADADSTNFSIGCWGQTTALYFYKGLIAYLLVADSPLSGGDRTALYSWISDYYGIGA